MQVMIFNREIATLSLFTVLTLNHTEHIPSIQPEIPKANMRQIWNMCKTNLKVNDTENDIFGKYHLLFPEFEFSAIWAFKSIMQATSQVI